jgi:uncharacterized membrane protein YbhN (UPF0104 family)
MKASKQLLFVAKVGVSLAFVAWLVLKVDWTEVWMSVRGVRLEFLAFYTLLLLLGIAISAQKWRFIAQSKDFEGSFGEYFFTYLSGMFINNFLPSFIGGDTYRAYWLGRAERRYSLAASTVIFDRFTGLVAAMLLAFSFALLRLDVMLASPLWLGINVVMAAGVAGVMLWPLVSSTALVRRLWVFLPDKLRRVLGEMRTHGRKGLLGPALAFSVVFHVVGIGLANLVLFEAFNYSVPLLNYFAVIFLISIVSSIPVSINNIGIKEWAYFTFFGMFSMNAEVAVTVAIVSRFLQMLISFAALPVYLGARREVLAKEMTA